MPHRIETQLRKLRKFLRHDLWNYESKQRCERAPNRIILLRVLSLAFEGLRDNQLFNRAASLSYSTLIGLGPLIAIIVMVTGTYFAEDAETRIKEALLFMAPTLQEYINLTYEANGEDPHYVSDLDKLITQIIEGSRDTLSQVNTAGGGAFGVIGMFVLMFVGIQLLISIEKTFNSIWGVSQGRDWGQRIVFYWTFITLGVFLGFGSTILLSASAISNLFGWLPFGETLTMVFIAIMPLISLCMLVFFLTFIYQFFPNTTVHFRPALIGAAIVAILLIANNYMSFIYVQQVIKMQSLYGSVGIILVLIVGIFFFWILILFGAQVTYAIQNVHFLTNRELWQRVSVRTQETVTLGAWLIIARRFANCAPPPSGPEISEKLKTPNHVVNAALNILVEDNWVTPIRQMDKEGIEDTVYHPSRPLCRYSLADFKELFANHGNSQGADLLESGDTILKRYRDIQSAVDEEDAQLDFDGLLQKYQHKG